MQPHFLQYTAEDFLEADEFLRWQRQPERTDLAEAWEKWLEEHPEKKSAIAKAKQQLERLTPRKLPAHSVDKDALWNRISEQTGSESDKTTPAKVRKLWPRLAGVAASLALLAAFWFLWPDSTTLEVARGDTLTYTLPDNSQVYLNAASDLTFRKGQWDRERTVHLRGEAFFQVTSGNSFTVETVRGDVTVLGTSFNVLQRGARFAVECREGRVEVRAPQSDAVVLAAGEAVRLTDGVLNRYDVNDTNLQPGWIKGVFRFDDQPLSEVFAELERQFNIDVQYAEEIGATSFTGVFESTDLNDALYNVTWPMGLRYTITEETVEITKDE
jgi:ferric-dicitrate binding protein FerR (iron transport regulator)